MTHTDQPILDVPYHPTRSIGRASAEDRITDRVGYSLNRSCPAQRVGLGRSDLAELNQRPGPMTFSYRSRSTYVNSPDIQISAPYFLIAELTTTAHNGGLGFTTVSDHLAGKDMRRLR